MNAQELWNKYKKINPSIGDDIDAWQFGAQADELARLVNQGKKTATASAYDLYLLEGEPLPQVGSYDVILDSKDQAVCIIEITSVYLVPFGDVSPEHARKEGEGDLSLSSWRKSHRQFFSPYFKEKGLEFSETSLIVCEEFRKVYPFDTTNA
ncbi:ASCH domain-containing protein [Streptococcus sp. 11273D007BW]